VAVLTMAAAAATLLLLLLLLPPLLVSGVELSSGGHSSPPPSVFYWSLQRARHPVDALPLSYEERALALAFQGIVNQRQQRQPALFLDAGALDFDWPEADSFWHDTLQSQGRLRFLVLEPSLCALVARGDPHGRVQGLVAYPSGDGDYGDGYSLAIALTVAGQDGLLPVDNQTLARNPCLRLRYDVKRDLRQEPAFGSGRASAWAWARRTLLPKASRSTVYNLWRWRQCVWCFSSSFTGGGLYTTGILPMSHRFWSRN
jgi:hypothetical protein